MSKAGILEDGSTFLIRCNNTGSFSHYTATTMYVQAIEKKLRNFRWNPTVEMDYRSQLKLLRADAPLC